MSEGRRTKRSPICSRYFVAVLLLLALYAMSTPPAIASSDRCWTEHPEYAIGEHIRLFVEVDVVSHYLVVITDADGHNTTTSPRRISIEKAQVPGDLGYVGVATQPVGQWTVKVWRSNEEYKVDTSGGPAAVCHFSVAEGVDRCWVRHVTGETLTDNPTFFVGENFTLYLNISIPRSTGEYTYYIISDQNNTISTSEPMPALQPGLFYDTLTAEPPLGQQRVELWWSGDDSSPITVCYFQVAAPPEIQNAITTRAQNQQQNPVAGIYSTWLTFTGFVLVLSGVIAAAVWNDAKNLGEKNAPLWALGTFLVLIVVLPVYLIFRSKGMIGGSSRTPDQPIQATAGEAQPFSSSTMYCPECGKTIPRNSKFCKECGAKLVD